MDKSTTEFKLEKKSVNSKILCNEIQHQIEDLIINGEVLWSSDTHRESFVETIDDLLSGLHEQGKLDQWNVMCDLRNNSIDQMDRGIYTFESSYKQKNCLNTTRLIYTIKDLLIASLRELLDTVHSP
jgi:hypothetical protein